MSSPDFDDKFEPLEGQPGFLGEAYSAFWFRFQVDASLREDEQWVLTSITRAIQKIQQRRSDLLELPIGGTATGTGANSHPEFRNRIVQTLSDLTSKKFIQCTDTFEGLQSRSQLVSLSGSIKELAIELLRISNDLRLLNSGPDRHSPGRSANSY